MRVELLKSLRQALAVRKIRNENRLFFTNNQSHVSTLQQLKWYFGSYLKAAARGEYRVFVALNEESEIMGYGALRLNHLGELLITECVAHKFKRRGVGSQILKSMLALAREERRILVAETLRANHPSIELYRRHGLKQVPAQADELVTYISEESWRSPEQPAPV